MASGINVRGLANVQRALRDAEKDVRLGMRKELREFSEPVRSTAESLAAAQIGPVPWSRMRTGVTTNSVYVVSRKRGTRNRRRQRPNLARKLYYGALVPSLERHQPTLEQDFNAMLYRVATKFNRGGV